MIISSSITSSILKYYKIETKFKSLKELDTELEKNYKNVFLWIIDGFGHYNLEELLDKSALLRNGEIKSISTVYPSTTVAATTVATSGQPPVETAWVGWHQYFKEYKEDYMMFLDFAYYNKNAKCERNIEFDLMKTETIWEKVVKKGYYGNFIYPGFRTKEVKCFKDQCNMVLDIAKDSTKTGYTYIYWDKLDSLMHEYGVNSREVKLHALEINDCLEELQQKLPEDSLLIVTADHGHIDIEYIDLEDYQDIVSLFKLKPSIENRACSFYIQEGKHEQFKELFNKYFKDDFVLYTHDQVFDMKLE